MPDPYPPKEIGCHHTGFQKKCRDLVTKGLCNRWVCLIGADPNTGETLNHYNCIDNWVLKLGLEQSQMSRQTGAAVESFRNCMVELNTGIPQSQLPRTNWGVDDAKRLTDDKRE